MAKARQKILEGWKYPIYYGPEGFEPDTKPILAEKIIDLLVEEGVPRKLIRKRSSWYNLLDFDVRVDNPEDPKLAIVTICTMSKKDDSCALANIFEIPFDKKERSRRYSHHKPAVHHPTWHRI